MKLKKGADVRIRRTNEIGTIKEIELVRKGGIVHKYCHVVTQDKPDLWLDSSELTDVTEKCVVRFANSDGQYLTLTADYDHKKQDLILRIGEGIPKNLKEQDGLHVVILNKILVALARQYQDCKIDSN